MVELMKEIYLNKNNYMQLINYIKSRQIILNLKISILLKSDEDILYFEYFISLFKKISNFVLVFTTTSF